jgi:ClpP class serine protease
MSLALAAVLRQEWVTTQHSLRTILNVASRNDLFPELRKNLLDARDGQPLRNARLTMIREGSVAVIHVVGPMVRHASLFSDISGATSYEDIRKDLQLAIDDPSIKTIIFKFDSPGGEVTGCSECADAIYAARTMGKKTIAYVEVALSGAMWLASACEEIVIADTGEVGSIGCIMAWYDDTESMAMNGVKEVKFISSQSRNKNADPATDAGKEQYQTIVDDIGAVFIGKVARGRAMTEADVVEQGGEGKVLVGQRGVDAGLADRMDNFEALLASVNNQQEKSTMNPKILAALGLPADATAEQAEGRIAELTAFQRTTLQAVGATETADARGKIVAGAEALRDLPGVRTELETARAEGSRRDLRATLEQGLSAQPPRLSLGRIQRQIPIFIFDEKRKAEMVAAFSKMKTTTKDNVLDAACSVPVTTAELKAIQSYVAQAEPTTAEPIAAPARPDEHVARHLSDLDREVGESLGLQDDSVQKYGRVRSADDLRKKDKQAAGGGSYAAPAATPRKEA